MWFICGMHVWSSVVTRMINTTFKWFDVAVMILWWYFVMWWWVLSGFLMAMLCVSLLSCIRCNPGVVGRADELDDAQAGWKPADRFYGLSCGVNASVGSVWWCSDCGGRLMSMYMYMYMYVTWMCGCCRAVFIVSFLLLSELNWILLFYWRR